MSTLAPLLSASLTGQVLSLAIQILVLFALGDGLVFLHKNSAAIGATVGVAFAHVMDHYVTNPMIRRTAASLVRWAEARITTPKSGDQKYAEVSVLLKRAFPFLSDEQIDHAIEEAHVDLKMAMGGFAQGLLEATPSSAPGGTITIPLTGSSATITAPAQSST